MEYRNLFSRLSFLYQSTNFGYALAKFWHWNSFRTNLKFSESLRNFYPNQTVSFRSNQKLVFHPNQSEAHSKSIRINPIEFGQTELIRINPNESGESDKYELSIRMNPVYPNDSVIFSFIRIDRIHSDWKFESI